MAKQTVELNGKHYDAVSGEPVRSTTSLAAPRHTAANHTRRHAAQSSQTLMRRAVKKPAVSPHFAVIHPVQRSAMHAIEVKRGIRKIDDARHERARSIAQSPHVSRYSQAPGVTVSYASIPVQPEPKQLEKEAPSAPPPLQAHPATDMFEKAIEHATHYVDIAAERMQFNRKKRLHAVHMTAGLTALAVVAGFAFFLNSPAAQIRLSGLKSGINRSTPDLKATGFRYAGVQTKDDTRVLGLADTAGNYQLRQTPTNWSGSAMIKSVSATAASGARNYQEIRFAGYTVYRLSNGTYTWVKNGIWYQFSPTDGHKAIPLDKLSALIQNS